MEKRKFVICHHEIDEETKEYVLGKGFVGTCKLCGAPLVQARFTRVKPRSKPKMSKKERLRLRRAKSST